MQAARWMMYGQKRLFWVAFLSIKLILTIHMHPHTNSHQAPSPLTFPAYTPMVLTHFHNRFISRNRWHGITHCRRGLKLQHISAAHWVGQTGAGGSVDTDNGIHPRHLSSHRLQVSEILSTTYVS
jgi:hypothetical protein